MDNKSTNPPPASQPKDAPGFVKAIAFILALLLVIAIPLALLAFDMWRVIFNPPYVKTVITDEAINSDLIPVALEWFSDRRAQQRVEAGEALTGIDEPDIQLLMSFLDREDWRGIKTEILTDEFLTHVVSVTVDGTYAWVDSADRVPQINWDLAPFKERVNTEHGVNAITIAYDNLPPCKQEEIDDFLFRLSLVPPGTQVLYNLCEFPDPWHEDQFNDYLDALFKVVDNIPDDFALTAELSRVNDQGGVGAEALKGQLRLTRLLGMLAWVLPVALVLLIGALVVRSLRTASRWIGVPLVVGGFLALLPALSYRVLIVNVVAAGALSETPDVIRVEVLRIIGRFADAIFQPMLIQAAIIVVLGIGLLVWYWFSSRQKKATPVTSAPAAS